MGDEDGGEGNSDSVRFPVLNMGEKTEGVGNEDEEVEFPTTDVGGEWWGFGDETVSTKVECMVLLTWRGKYETRRRLFSWRSRVSDGGSLRIPCVSLNIHQSLRSFEHDLYPSTEKSTNYIH